MVSCYIFLHIHNVAKVGWKLWAQSLFLYILSCHGDLLCTNQATASHLLHSESKQFSNSLSPKILSFECHFEKVSHRGKCHLVSVREISVEK